MTDMHTHTRISADSDETMAAYIARANEIGVNTICITDHADWNPFDTGWKYYDEVSYFADFEYASKNSDGVELLAGVEFGEPHLYRSEFEKLCNSPFDFVIGSVHYTNSYPEWFFNVLIECGVSAEDCYNSYWDSVLDCVSYGGFDCLGHIDIPKRYYKTLLYDESKIRVIYRRMLDNGIILEINTSSLRRGLDVAMPDRELLDIYKREGGKFATIGSDAHRAEDLAAGNSEAEALLKEFGLTEVTFRNRVLKEVNK
ncbi:MAG: histidinol-phosphatase HisJ family protein [Oscillospiraceae bacterium]|jgi:histidinol-phosphatase (PHP family)|nr:histidinol-phosphatase HisJ family protein [Oscillospiraceae bacterium]